MRLVITPFFEYLTEQNRKIIMLHTSLDDHEQNEHHNRF